MDEHLDDDGKVSDSSMPPSRRPLLPPCRICDGKASGFHYGVNTCEACKGFFRRSMARSIAFTCSRNNSCPILPGRRNNCPACRMKKCRDIGMSKSAIRTGRYSYEVHTQYIEEVKSTKASDLVKGKYQRSTSLSSTSSSTVLSPSTVSSLSPSAVSSPPMSSFDASLETIDTISGHNNVSQSGSCLSDNVTHQCSSDISACTSQNIYSSSLTKHVSGTVMTDSKSREWLTLSGSDVNKTCGERIQGYSDEENSAVLKKLMSAQDGLLEDLDEFLDHVRMSKRKQEFLEMPSASFHEFERTNAPLDSSHRDLQNTEKINKDALPDTTSKDTPDNPNSRREDEKNRIEKMHEVAQMMDSELRNMVTFVKTIPGWRSICIEDQIALIRESAVEVWLIGHYACLDADLGTFTGEFNSSRESSAEIYNDEYLMCLYRTAGMFQKLDLKKEEIIILKTILLTFTDRCILVDNKAVEKVQLRMVDCYQYVCQLLGINYSKRFPNIINKLVSARELSEKFKSIVVTVVSHWEVIEKYPLVKEFFSGYKV